jgi:regulator of nucleoside diphosphate kinase
MHPIPLGERRLTHADFVRLSKLHGGVPQDLVDLLDEAQLLAPQAVPASIVMMHVPFDIEDPRTHQRQRLAICCPGEADAGAGRISVLSPAGLALLGLGVGDTARWPTPDGSSCAARVVAVLAPPAS